MTTASALVPAKEGAKTSLLLATLPSIAGALRQGAVAVIEWGRIRIRALPIDGADRAGADDEGTGQLAAPAILVTSRAPIADTRNGP